MSAETPAIGSPERSHADAPPREASDVAPLVSFLDSLLKRQISLGQADAGLIWLFATPTRQAGTVAIHQDPERPLHRAWSRAVLHAIDRHAPSMISMEDGSPRVRVESVSVDPDDSVYRSDRGHLVVIIPLIAEGTVEGVSALVIAGSDRRAASEAGLRASLAASAFETYLWRENALREAQGRARLRETLELLDASIQGQNTGAVCAILCHELRRRFGCVRVSIGLLRGDSVRLVGMSGTDTIDRKAPAAEPIESAMEECAAQDVELEFPQPPHAEQSPMTRRVVRSHKLLSMKAGPSAIVSLPLRIEGDLVGVLLLERAINDPFPAGALSLLRLLAEFVGPCVHTRRMADRGVVAVARDRVGELARAAVGPRHTAAKAICLMLTLVLVGLAVIPIPDRIRSSAEVRAVTTRTIPPPFSGYLSEALVRPGDFVEAGDVIGRMDTSELSLQLEQEIGRRETLATERDSAHATGDLAAWRRAAKGVEESEAKIGLLRSYIVRSEIRAPIAGQISRGDLRDYLGARVEPTTALFEIVTPDRMVVTQIDERDIARVRPGQDGWMSTAASPGTRIPLRIVRINPSAEPTEGANVYTAEADVLAHDRFLQPGMRGHVRLRSGWTTGLVMLTRPIVDEIRLRLWW